MEVPATATYMVPARFSLFSKLHALSGSGGREFESWLSGGQLPELWVWEKSSEYEFIPVKFLGRSILGHLYEFSIVWARGSGMSDGPT